MNRRMLMAAAATLGLALAAPVAMADDKAVVTAFYTDILSKTTEPGLEAKIAEVLAPGWESYGDYASPPNDPAGLAKGLAGYGAMIPDLKWEIVEMIQSGDRYIVRGRATGTPAGPFFGVDGEGRGFEIMSIDIHTVADGKIATSYHIEDWAGALRQLKGQ